MNKKIKTILFHVPLLIFQYFGILSCTQKNIDNLDINYFEPLGLSIFITMIIITIFMTYKLNSIHKYTREVYLVVLLLTPTFIGLFDNHIVSSLLSFLIYSGVFYYMDKIKNNFKVYCAYAKNDSEHLVKKFYKISEAKRYIRYIIEEKLNDLCPKSNTEIDLINLYFKTRKYIYKIENDDFNEDDYVKEIALRVYNQYINKIIDGGFNKYNKKEELKLLANIENSNIISINEKNRFIEIICEKDSKKIYLTIEQTMINSSRNGIFSFFIIDNKKLQDTHSSKILNDISKIIKIFHLSKSSEYKNIFRKDILEIIYKSNKGKINSCRLTLNVDYKNGINLSIQKYEDIFSFKTRVLDDKGKTQLLYFYCTQYFCPKLEYNYLEEVYDESKDCENLSPQIRRKTICDYDYDFPLTTFGKKIRFELLEDGGINAYNISHSHISNPISLPNKEIYNYLNEDEKKKLHHFLAIAQIYLNDLFVNREFDNLFIIDTFENTEDIWKLDKLDEILENSNWVQKRYYDDSEQGHPAGMLVDIYSKESDENKKFVVFNENDYLSFRISVKYNDDVKKEVEALLKVIIKK